MSYTFEQGCMPECIKYYKEERNKQAQLVLHPVVAMVGRAMIYSTVYKTVHLTFPNPTPII
jgi:amino acid permease